MRNRALFWLGVLWMVLAGVTLGYELRRQPRLIIQWTTETEVNTAGFNIYRAVEPEGSYEKINAQLIPSKGDPLTGSEYEFVDVDVQPGQTYYYQLEDVEVNGQTNRAELTSGQTPTAQSWVLGLGVVGLLVGVYLLVSSLRTIKSPLASPDLGKVSS